LGQTKYDFVRYNHISSTVKPSKFYNIEGGEKISSSEVGGRKGDMFLIDI
jgi:hypothetical protein